MQREESGFQGPDPLRRALMQGGLVIAGGFILAGRKAAAAEALSPPAYNPSTQYAFTILATIADTLPVGDTATGQIRAIPITGGEVKGEGVAGRVVPGGADWQRTRPDGVTELEATYAIQMSDGTAVKVVNRGILVPPSQEGAAPYFRTAIEFTAPTGKWQWLNEAIFLCRAGLAPDRERTVQIDVFKLV
jgi:hypothetical protein